MKDLLLLLVFMPLAVASQTDTLKDRLRFCPMENGNLWQYQFSELWFKGWQPAPPPYSIEVLADTVMPNGQSYRILRKQNIPPPQLPNYMYERLDTLSGSVFQYDATLPDSERQIDSLFANPGDSFEPSWADSTIFAYAVFYKTTCVSIEKDTLFGTPTETMSLTNGFTSGYTKYTLAKGLGFYYASYLFSLVLREVVLVYAKISGVEYGTKIPTTITSPNTLPTSFSVSQNYPNPFNATTVINYRLPSSAVVVLKVFDVLGREIETLVNNRQSAGDYSIKFDGTNLPSGVYFYKLEAESYLAVKKLLLLK